MKCVISLFLFLSLFYSVLADDPEKKPDTRVVLSGTVTSGNDYIPFATIIIEGTSIGTAADVNGRFKLHGLPDGKQTVSVSAVGFKTFSQALTLDVDSSIILRAELIPDNIGIEQVVVSADRNARSRHNAPTIVNSIGSRLLQRTQSITLSEGLNFSPGLRMENNCQNCGFSQLRMNGLEGPYTQILINSRPVFSGLAGVYGLELIPASMIDRVEVIRGGGSALYGSNAIAGTVNLITKDPISNAFSAGGNYGLSGTAYENPAPDLSLNVNGSVVTRNYKAGVTLFGFYRKRNPFDANNDGFSEIASISNKTFGARFFRRMANRGKITIDYFNINEFRRGGNKFNLPLHEADISESVDHAIHSGAATFDLLMHEADKLSVFFSAQQVDRDSYYGANQDPSAYGETKDFTYSSGIQYLKQLPLFFIAPASLISGVEFNGSSLVDNKLGYFDPIENIHYSSTRISNQHLTSRAGFLQSEMEGNDWVLTAGLRFDHYQIADRTGKADDVSGNVLSPRLSLLYKPGHHWQFRAGFGTGFRAPQIFDEDLHIETSGSRQVLHQNDPDLKQETSRSFTVSTNYTCNEGKWQYQLLAEGFHTQLMNPFANEYGSVDQNGIVIYRRVNAEKGATVQGINFEFNASPSIRWQMQSGFTIQRSIYQEPQEFEEIRFFRSPDYYGYLSLNFAPSVRLNLSATGNYTGAMLVPYFGPDLTNPADGELRTSQPFFDTGLKAAYTFRISGSLNLEWNAGIKNLLNSFQKDFDTGIGRDPAYIYGPVTPRTVYMGVRIGNLL